MKELIVINGTPLNGETVESLVSRVNAAIDDGRLSKEDILNIRLRLKFMEDFTKALKASKSFAEKSVEAALEFRNVPFQFGLIPEVSQKTTYSYDHCPAWKDAKAELVRIENAMKQLANSDAELVTADGEETSAYDAKTGKPLLPAAKCLSEQFVKWIKP